MNLFIANVDKDVEDLIKENCPRHGDKKFYTQEALRQYWAPTVVTSKKELVVKKVKEKLNFDSWPCIPDPQILKDWLKAKKAAKGSISQTAMNTVGKEVHKAVARGFTVDECLEKAESAKWRGFESDWMKREGNGNNNGRNQYSSGPKQSLTERASEQAREAFRIADAQADQTSLSYVDANDSII